MKTSHPFAVRVDRDPIAGLDPTDSPIGRRRPRRLHHAGVLAMVVMTSAAGLADTSGTATACDAVVIPAIDIDRCTIAGGQPEIDSGSVVRVDTLSSSSVHWLAGHRTSHGGPFRTLVDLEHGDIVRYRDAQYRITDYRLANRFDPQAMADWIRSTTPSVILQTSQAGSYVHVWRAVEFAPVVAPQPFELEVVVPSIAPGRMAVLNVTAVNTTGTGYVTVYPCDQPRPDTSNLNTATGTVRSNLVIVDPDPTGRVCLYSSTTTDLIIDTIATITTPTTNTTPTRLHDTRTTN